MYDQLKIDAMNRITRECKKAIDYYKEHNAEVTIDLLIDDPEIKPEIQNLIRIIIEEHDES